MRAILRRPAYFGLRQSDDPRSVLYGNILGTDDLDGVGEDF